MPSSFSLPCLVTDMSEWLFWMSLCCSLQPLCWCRRVHGDCWFSWLPEVFVMVTMNCLELQGSMSYHVANVHLGPV
jgi:hypothetical protein